MNNGMLGSCRNNLKGVTDDAHPHPPPRPIALPPPAPHPRSRHPGRTALCRRIDSRAGVEGYGAAGTPWGGSTGRTLYSARGIIARSVSPAAIRIITATTGPQAQGVVVSQPAFQPLTRRRRANTCPGAGHRKRGGGSSPRRSGKDRTGVGGNGAGPVSLAGANGGIAGDPGVVGGGGI